MRGIPLKIHATLGLVFLWMIFQLGWIGLPAGVLLFGSVLLHELGHAVVAQWFGIRIASIDLHLLGGMALMQDRPKTPKQEMLIAAAGPAVSFVLAAIFFVFASAFGAQLVFTAPRWVDLFAYGAAVNFGMGLFNLIPALPMDGGRIFRAGLQTRMGKLRATQLAAKVSRAFSFLFIFFGLIKGMWSLALIGAFVYFLAKQEEREAERIDEEERYGGWSHNPNLPLRPRPPFGGGPPPSFRIVITRLPR